jgi:hypothetical protein
MFERIAFQKVFSKNKKRLFQKECFETLGHLKCPFCIIFNGSKHVVKSAF